MNKIVLLLIILTFVYVNINAQQVQELVAYYPFSGNANDASGKGNNGVVNNAKLTSDRFGNPNSAYFFDGAYTWIEVPPDNSFDLTNALTLSAWIKVSDIPLGGTYIMAKNLKEDDCEYGFSFNAADYTYRIKASMGGYNLVNTNGVSLNTCGWYHILATFQYPGNCVLYINGVQVESLASTGPISPQRANFTIGRVRPQESILGFKGCIDDIRLYNYALPNSQILSLYSEGGYIPNSNILNVFAGNDVTINGNQSVTLTAIATGGGAPYNYIWSTGANTQSITVSPVATTSYSVTVIDDHRCNALDNVTVNVLNINYACGNNNQKVLVCHNNEVTICIAPEAVPAHLAHGDYLGPCNNNSVMPSENHECVHSTELIQNYPNPFNPVTSINYRIAENSFVMIKIYDIMGREIAVLVNEIKTAGNYMVDWNASEYPSGIYFYRMTAGNYTDMRRMILLK